MEAPPPLAVPVKLDAAGRIDQDITCIRCGYNLRGLSMDGVCPECGTAVGRSFQGDLLKFASPDWVDTLASGMNWIVAGIVVIIVFGILAFAVGMTRGLSGSGGYVAHALGIIGVIGYWKVATPDPARLESEPAITARSLVRFTAVFNYAYGFAEAGANALGGQAWQLVAIALGLIEIVGYFAEFIYARQLALRIPNLRLAAHTRIVMWGMVVTVGLTMVLALVSVLVSLGRGTAGVGMGVLMCPTTLGMMVFAIWSLVLLIWFRRELSAAALLARQTWASPTSRIPAWPGSQ